MIDPRTGEPAIEAVLSAVALPSATETDALSTALLTLGLAGLEKITRLRPNARCLAMSATDRVAHGMEFVEGAGRPA